MLEMTGVAGWGDDVRRVRVSNVGGKEFEEAGSATGNAGRARRSGLIAALSLGWKHAHFADHVCDAKMYHMKKASVRDLRYRFSEIERLLEQGEKIEITKRKQVIARLLPAAQPRSGRCPDFLARLRSIYGDRTLEISGAQLLAAERDRY